MIYIPPSGQSAGESNGGAEVERVQERMAAWDAERKAYLDRAWVRDESKQFHPRSAIVPGSTFGDWTVVREAEPKRIGRRQAVVRIVLVRCKCGVEKELYYQTIRSGHSKRCISCGSKGKRQNPTGRNQHTREVEP